MAKNNVLISGATPSRLNGTYTFVSQSENGEFDKRGLWHMTAPGNEVIEIFYYTNNNWYIQGNEAYKTSGQNVQNPWNVTNWGWSVTEIISDLRPNHAKPGEMGERRYKRLRNLGIV